MLSPPRTERNDSNESFLRCCEFMPDALKSRWPSSLTVKKLMDVFGTEAWKKLEERVVKLCEGIEGADVDDILFELHALIASEHKKFQQMVISGGTGRAGGGGDSSGGSGGGGATSGAKVPKRGREHRAKGPHEALNAKSMLVLPSHATPAMTSRTGIGTTCDAATGFRECDPLFGLVNKCKKAHRLAVKTINFERDTITFNVPDGATSTFSIPNSASVVAAFELPEKGASTFDGRGSLPLANDIMDASEKVRAIINASSLGFNLPASVWSMELTYASAETLKLTSFNWAPDLSSMCSESAAPLISRLQWAAIEDANEQLTIDFANGRAPAPQMEDENDGGDDDEDGDRTRALRPNVASAQRGNRDVRLRVACVRVSCVVMHRK